MIDNLKTAFLVLARPKQVFMKTGERQIGIWLTTMVLISITLLAKPVLTAPAMQAQNQKALKATLAQMEKDEANGKNQVPSEVKAQMRRSAKEGASIGLLMVSGAAATIGLWAGAALSGLLIIGLVKLLKGSITYKAALAIVGLAFMPFFIGEAIKIAAAAGAGSLAMGEGMSSLIMSNPTKMAAAGPTLGGGPGFALALVTLSRIDIFVIWSLVLLALGTANLAGLTKVKGAVAAILYWLVSWAVVALPGVVAGALFSTITSGPSTVVR